MGFNLAVWDNHVGNNQHSFQRLFIIVHYLCSPNLTLQKMVSTCVQSQWNSGENSLFFYPWRFTLKFPLHHLNWIWWIEKLWTIFHLYAPRFSLILSQLDDDVASLSPVYAFNSKLKIIHHSSIVDFISLICYLTRVRVREMRTQAIRHGMEKTRKKLSDLCLYFPYIGFLT